MNKSIRPWTIRLSRISDFWQPVVTVRDQNGDPVNFTDGEITITPDNGDTVVLWNIGNGKLTAPAANKFGFLVLKTVIAAYTWNSATYKWRVTYTNGRVEGDWLEGRVLIED